MPIFWCHPKFYEKGYNSNGFFELNGPVTMEMMGEFKVENGYRVTFYFAYAFVFTSVERVLANFWIS